MAINSEQKYIYTMHNEDPYEIMRNAMDKWNEVMNGANSALKDQTVSLLSREINKTYVYRNEYTRFNDYDRMVDMKIEMT